MQRSHALFEGAIPENYHRHLGPYLFAPCAHDLAARLPDPPPRRVLELACGTGILTRELRAIVPPDGTIAAIDLNGAMIEFARSQPDAPWAVDWRVADMTALPFSDHSFDAVVCQHGFMFVEERPRAVREAYRVLEPGGILLFSVWDSIERNRFGKVAHETIASFFPDQPPTFYETPFNMHEPQDALALLEGAGFVAATVHRAHLRAEAPSSAELARGLVRGNPVIAEIRERETISPEKVLEAVERAVGREFGAAPTRFDLHVLVFSARKVKK